MARMMIQSKRYQDLVAFAAKPAANASGEQRADLKFLTGVAYFEQQKPKEALSAFTQAAQNGNVSGAPPLDQLLERAAGRRRPNKQPWRTSPEHLFPAWHAMTPGRTGSRPADQQQGDYPADCLGGNWPLPGAVFLSPAFITPP